MSYIKETILAQIILETCYPIWIEMWVEEFVKGFMLIVAGFFLTKKPLKWLEIVWEIIGLIK